MAADPTPQHKPPIRQYVAARVDQVPEGGRLIVDVGDRSIGIFCFDGEYHALVNICPHLSGPLCEGPVLAACETVHEVGTYRYDVSRRMLTCPWHGWEFDIRTGQSYLDPKRLRARRLPIARRSGAELQEDAEPGGVKGPYAAEVIDIERNGEYLVVTMRDKCAVSASPGTT